MKKVIFSALVLTGGLFACSKASVNNETPTSNDVVVATKALGQGNGDDGNPKRTWHDDGTRPNFGATYGCVGMGGTCPQVRILPPADALMFEDMRTNGQSTVANFVTYQSRLADYFTETTVSEVITGMVQVELLDSLDTEMFCIFTKGSTVIKVIPVKR